MEGRSRLGWLLIGLQSKDVGLCVGKSASLYGSDLKGVRNFGRKTGLVDTMLPRKASKR